MTPSDSRSEMDVGGPPVVEDDTRPTMSEDRAPDVMGHPTTAESRDAGHMTDEDGTQEDGGAAVAAGQGEPVRTGAPSMTEPAPAVEPTSAGEAGEDYPDMEPLDAGTGGRSARDFTAAAHGEAYVRLVMEVDDQDMRVRDASVVDGPLAEQELAGDMAYEAVVRGRRVSAGGLGDLSRQHGYAPPGQEEVPHRVSEARQYQFVVRIPRSDITLDELGELEIGLVRPATTTELAEGTAALPGAPFADAAIAAGREPPALVAKLEGVDVTALPDRAVEQLRRGLR